MHLCALCYGFSIAPNLQPQYQALSTFYEVWEKAKKNVSNDDHRLYSVILQLNYMKLGNMDMQAYLSKLDALKANFTILIPFTIYATTHVEQRSKYFMVMALIRLPPEQDSVCNQILSGSTIRTYDKVSEQLLHLAIPHAFGPVSLPSFVAHAPGDIGAFTSIDNN